MRLQQDGTYVSVDRPVLFYFGALVIALSFGIAAWRHYQTHGSVMSTAGFAFGMVACIVLGLALPCTKVVFDPYRKLITWSWRSMFKGDAGQMGFADVNDVVIQSSEGDEGKVFYRVALSTEKRIVPLSIQYVSERAKVEQRAKEIRAVLGLPPDVVF